jgi:hypothetical protein
MGWFEKGKFLQCSEDENVTGLLIELILRCSRTKWRENILDSNWLILVNMYLIR